MSNTETTVRISNVTKLGDVDSYSTWASQLQTYLRTTGKWDVVDPDSNTEATEGQGASAFHALNVTITGDEYRLLLSTIDESSKTAARDLWGLIKEAVAGTEQVDAGQLYQEIMELRVETSAIEYIANMRRLRRRLKECGNDIDDAMFKILLLRRIQDNEDYTNQHKRACQDNIGTV